MDSLLLPGWQSSLKVYDDGNAHELDATGRDTTTGYEFIEVNGERRMYSREAPTIERFNAVYGLRDALDDVMPLISRSDLSAAIKQKNEQQSWIDDWQDFPPMDQDGLPICWTQGDCAGAATLSVMAGLSYEELSGSSIAVPISGGNSGGWEGDTLDYMVRYGAAAVNVWPNVATNRRYLTDPAVAESRKKHMTLEALTLNYRDRSQRFLAVATALINNMPVPFAYNWMSHVMYFVRVVEIEAGSFGLMVRNSWGNWGAKNRFGYAGYNVYREGKGTPDSAHCLRQVTVSTAA